ncbi:MAG: sigma-70 family RNA polymerase sigma factor [Planctomycetes bacterium]|nr:sigma-70 family RNA polymerase sigma factor [Planctomycetota bacterium]
MNDTAAQITQLLSRLQGGDNGAAEQLMPLLYAELHARASAMMRRESEAMTLQPTALLHEAWVRLQEYSAGRETTYTDRTHFLRLAGKVMRNVLVDHARRRRRRAADEPLGDELAIAIGPGPDERADVLDLQVAMQRLAERDAELEEIVELRFFGGLTLQETADALGKTTSSVHRAWELARAFLLRELKKES